MIPWDCLISGTEHDCDSEKGYSNERSFYNEYL